MELMENIFCKYSTERKSMLCTLTSLSGTRPVNTSWRLMDIVAMQVIHGTMDSGGDGECTLKVILYNMHSKWMLLFQ